MAEMTKAKIIKTHTGQWIVVIQVGEKVYGMTYPNLELALEWMGNTLNDGGVTVTIG